MREMKDSNTLWCDKIPQNWDTRRVKYIAIRLCKGNGITKEDIVANGDTPCVRYGEIYTKYNQSFYECATRTNKAIISSKQYFTQGDILFAGTGELIEEIGKNIVYLGTGDCLAGGDIIILKHKQNARYLNYALNSEYVQAQKSCNKAKLKVVHISTFEIGNIRVAIPVLSEQQKIADFLDKECGKIDGLKADIQVQIDTLEQYKRSVITEAVTHGLNPSAPMKDSGIPWVGEIPKEWSVKKIKHISYVIGGNGFNVELQGLESGDYPFCKASDISNAGKYLDKAANYVTFDIVRDQHYNIIPKGAILFPKIGEAMKKNNRTICVLDCCADNNCQAIVPFERNSGMFLYYILTCVNMGWFDNAGTIPCMNNRKFLNSKVPFPPLDEQQEIADYLDNKCAEIEQIIADKKTQIETLDGYKKSLIYEYVTGKKEVV